MALAALALPLPAGAAYTNFESSHVHPVALTPDGARLLAVNTPDARLEVFTVEPDGSLSRTASIPVGLEPVSVRARTASEAWVVNHLSDSVSVVDLAGGFVVRTLRVGDEPMDVAFARNRAFVSIAGSDEVSVYDLADLGRAPVAVPIFGRKPRALAVANDGSAVYAVVQQSGNLTTVVNAFSAFSLGSFLDPLRLQALGIADLDCRLPPPAYPPLPAGITRNPLLIDPPDGIPRVALIVKWDEARGRWVDDAGQDWNGCTPYRLPDHDLFVIDTTTLAVQPVDHIGTTLFEVSVSPADGRLWVPHTEARNQVRFEHPLGVQGHIVDNRVAVIDPSSAFAVGHIDLNGHIDPASDPRTNLAERQASVSQPGMMAWKADGSAAYLTALGSGKVFRLDPACAAPSCIFGPDRTAPAAAATGEGPSGVVLHEGVGRLYVLNRFTNRIALVDEGSLAPVGEVALHDPGPAVVRQGRRFLYDAVTSSRHGDAACATCHVSGHLDGLAWDLGDPTGDFAPYALANDNVRFVVAFGGVLADCDPATCAAHQGFDPQKGPMTTQTFRGMLEPLHWRGDRATFEAFNPAFVGLLGAADIGPPTGPRAGLSAADMAAFRQFTLGIRFPPNPHRAVDDTIPDQDVPIPGSAHVGNPTAGESLYLGGNTDGGGPCVTCHTLPFGAGGGRLGGVTPAEPTSRDASPLFNGDLDLSPHSDLKIPHLRNLFEKVGPTHGLGTATPDARSGFGYSHDGSIPDLLTFFSVQVFTLPPANTAEEVRDITSFLFHFPTETKPCVGQQVTLAAGPAPTGSPAEEALLATLLGIADGGDPLRHGELVASGLVDGRTRAYHLLQGAWVPDRETEGVLSTSELRRSALGPLTFTCTPIDSGVRLGGDRDEDGTLDGDDCAPADPLPVTLPTVEVLRVAREGTGARLTWDEPFDPRIETPLVYEVVGGRLDEWRALGLGAATSCLKGDLPSGTWLDARPWGPAGETHYYKVRARSVCGAGSFGPDSAPIESLDCTGI